MPRAHKNKGQKSKGRSRAKHHRAHGDSQGVQPSAVGKSGSPHVGQANSPSSSNARTPKGAACLSSPDAGVSCTGSNLGAGGSDVPAVGGKPRAFQAEAFNQPICKDALTKKASMLVEFLLEKFQKSEEFTDDDMLKVVNKKYKTQFSDILRKSSSRMEMIFGMRLKKINPNSQSYAIVSKLGLSTAEILSGKRGLPKMGLLMTILGLIFTKGNRATEEEVWKFLSVLGVYAGRKHLIFGEPRKLITKDLVEQNYLEMHKMSEGKSSRYDFLWGSRAHVETSKMKVLEVWARINDTVPSFFPTPYEEALKDQMERAEQGSPALGCTAAMARVHPMSAACSSSHK
ncbi:melanoma-associated antigen B4 [Phodopus roborovskii]|uniref:Magebl1 protein n=1 Tax=Phodopus roborovskii TaxID=109678 RepID=A0AAU9Z054_PHORO|nr:melanoma-associated antigen B4 [Phodopus roborovskii]CAH6780285.1 Magebl1 [Phodopus roborovskii]